MQLKVKLMVQFMPQICSVAQHTQANHTAPRDCHAPCGTSASLHVHRVSTTCLPRVCYTSTTCLTSAYHRFTRATVAVKRWWPNTLSGPLALLVYSYILFHPLGSPTHRLHNDNDNYTTQKELRNYPENKQPPSCT